jgi:hypothetical protein
MGISIYRVVAVALISTSVLGSADSARASFASVVGTDAAYCVASSQREFDPEPCVVEQLELSPGNCWATTVPTCLIEDTTVEGYPTGPSAYGASLYFFEGDIGLEGVLSVSGSRISPQLFVISGEYLFGLNFFPSCVGTAICGNAEIALIRFAGDPLAFDGLVPKTVYDLVAAGLIQNSDILFVHSDFPGLPGQPFELAPLSFDVSVEGVPDDQIYLFSTFQTPLPEPSGPATLLAAAMGLCGLAKLKSHRRRR